MYGGRTWPWNTYRCGPWQCKPSFHGNWNETKPHAARMDDRKATLVRTPCQVTKRQNTDNKNSRKQPFMCNRDLYAETETCHDGNSPAGCPQRKTSICPVSETRPFQCQLPSFTNVDRCIWNAPRFILPLLLALLLCNFVHLAAMARPHAKRNDGFLQLFMLLATTQETSLRNVASWRPEY